MNNAVSAKKKHRAELLKMNFLKIKVHQVDFVIFADHLSFSYLFIAYSGIIMNRIKFIMCNE